jgi:hypothetical protein
VDTCAAPSGGPSGALNTMDSALAISIVLFEEAKVKTCFSAEKEYFFDRRPLLTLKIVNRVHGLKSGSGSAVPYFPVWPSTASSDLMSSYSTDLVISKLSNLNESQDSITSVSQCKLH